ncbi:MAG: hypothetical protein IKG75_07360, partial [Bacteroidaceae bacterium]|nr:hypothetical protein [Bacteroidaceae bacterium]
MAGIYDFYQLSTAATSHRAELKGKAFAKISSVVALQAQSDKRKSKSLETKSNRAEVKSNRVETDHFLAIRFFFLRIVTFFLVVTLVTLVTFWQILLQNVTNVTTIIGGIFIN